MSTRRGCYGVMLAAVLATAACTGGEDEPEPTIPTPSPSAGSPSPSSTTETTTSTPTPTSVSAAEQEEADVIATLEGYREALGAATRGEDSIEAIYPWAIGAAREQWVTQYLLYRERGWTITGEAMVDIVEVDIEGEHASIVACSDVADVEALDEEGESVIADDRLDQTLVDYVLKRSDPAKFGWVVVEDVNRDEPCEG